MKKVVLFLICILTAAILLGCGGDKTVSKDSISKILPNPGHKRVEIMTDDEASFYATVKKYSDEDFITYMEKCEECGFIVDKDKDEWSFDAYNDEGYHLKLKHIGKNMTIDLEAPKNFAEIKWPASDIAKLLPVPKSNMGDFAWEASYGFVLYVGETPKVEYDLYVEACQEKGFVEDYQKGDTFYYAYNTDGFYLTLRYDGNNIMFIRIDEPENWDPDEVITEEKDEKESKETISLKEEDEVEKNDIKHEENKPEEITEVEDAVFYSTNDYETAKKGNTGIFAYIDNGTSYDIYWIIDFDEGYVYYFTDGNGETSCDRLKIESGDLNSYITITYHDAGTQWSYKLHFKYVNHPETLIMVDQNGFDWKYSTTDLDDALAIRDTKEIKDY